MEKIYFPSQVIFPQFLNIILYIGAKKHKAIVPSQLILANLLCELVALDALRAQRPPTREGESY